MSATTELKPWQSLGEEEQLVLRRHYQVELDKQPMTCSLEEKTARFAAWLAEHGVSFTAGDLRRKTR